MTSATVVVVRTDVTNPPPPITVFAAPFSNGAYRTLVPAPGEYRIDVTAAGFSPSSLTFSAWQARRSPAPCRSSSNRWPCPDG